MTNSFMAAGAMIAVLAFGQQAQANQISSFSLSGSGIGGAGFLSFMPDPINGDPVGANVVNLLTGTFSDSNNGLGISNEKITGLVPTLPNPGNAPFATSLSLFPVSGPLLPPIDGGVLSYDNLFYPFGAPDTCFDGITGGFVDVFGLLFTLADGDTVDLWSNGGSPNDSPQYGAAVVDPSGAVVDYVNSGVTMQTPEPGSVWLLGAGLLGVLAWRRRPAKFRTTAARNI